MRVVCVRWGYRYDDRYVLNLRDGVSKNLSIPHKFQCITARPVHGVDCVPELCEWPGWWQKIGLFRPGFITGPTLYLDLSLVPVASLDWVLDYTGQLAMRRAWRREEVFASGCMVFGGQDVSAVWHAFRPEVMARYHPYGDQEFITNTIGPSITPIEPDHIASFKWECTGGQKPGASLIAFHGTPKPAEVHDEWVRQHWR